ncbi:MAG TPA: SDR family NAD(P)-dependent oxidoreductase, partial [Ilumatobacteraceae bacterium]
MDISIVRAMIVGGASGMARATAERIAAAGGAVAILDRAGSGGDVVAAAIGGTFIEADITDFAGVEVAIDAAVEALGGLDVAVNTAGGGIGARTLNRDGSPHDLDEFRRVIDLNLVATFNLNRLQAAHMAKNAPNADDE